MEEPTKNNSDLVSSWIEHESQERTREFRKYWSYRPTPQDGIEDLILSNSDKATEIISQIAKEIEDNEDLETKLICGLIYSLEHHNQDQYAKLLENLKDLPIHKYLDKA